MPEFSVVISVYNKEHEIARTLQSVLDQTFQDFEIVVLNDGSTDSSEAEILRFKDKRIRFFSEKNMGAGAGRNYVIKKATANYIALLDADDIWFPYYLEEQLRLIKTHPTQHIFATNSEFINNGTIETKNYSVAIDTSEAIIVNFFEASYQSSIINSSTTVVKRSVFETTGYFDPTIKSGQDTDLFIRFGLNYSVVFSPKVCVQIVVLINSLSRRTKKVSQKANFKAYEKYEAENPALKKYLDLNRYSLCLLAKLEGNKEAFQELHSKIDIGNLNKRQRFLLRRNATVFRFLLQTKERLSALGIRLSAYK